MKSTTLIYCGEDDGEAAKVLAASLRDGKSNVSLRSASAFTGLAETRCNRVVFTDGVRHGLRAAISAAHGLSYQVENAAPRKRGRPRKTA